MSATSKLLPIAAGLTHAGDVVRIVPSYSGATYRVQRGGAPGAVVLARAVAVDMPAAGVVQFPVSVEVTVGTTLYKEWRDRMRADAGKRG